MTQVSVGQTIAILHYIRDSFGITSPGKLSWFMASFSLTIELLSFHQGDGKTSLDTKSFISLDWHGMPYGLW